MGVGRTRRGKSVPGAYNGEKIGWGRDNAREFLRETGRWRMRSENKARESLAFVAPGVAGGSAHRSRAIDGVVPAPAGRARKAEAKAD